MREGWPAKGLLKPFWLAHGGRQAVAKTAGVSEGHLSKVNAGKANLGHDVATKLVKTYNVSVLELGAPVEEADEKGQTFLQLLAGLSTAVAGLEETVDRLDQRLTRLEQRRGSGGSRLAGTTP